ncbi:hypothetical protein [Rhodoblastus sp.]|uniref:hypothetical protein n=1 Tax=Rhodoblastus sp. TaxID=1962975 RepID=UPI0026398F3E|nr:hypothetical protein [Rhodoblastus sp.]
MSPTQRQRRHETQIEFWIGRDAEGFWTARGADGREGGLFVSRDAAMKFVTSARRGQGVARCAPAPIKLWK